MTTDGSPEAQAGSPPAFSLRVSYGPASFEAAGPGELVLQAFAEFKDHVKPVAAPTPTTEADSATEGNGSKPDEKSDVTSGGGSNSEPLPVFMDQFDLKGNAQTALAVAVWAKHSRNETELDPDGLKEYWRTSRHKVPANVGRDVGVAAKEGWLERLSHGKYTVTSYGERTLDALRKTK
jgi:hypothetical protein